MKAEVLVKIPLSYETWIVEVPDHVAGDEDLEGYVRENFYELDRSLVDFDYDTGDEIVEGVTILEEPHA